MAFDFGTLAEILVATASLVLALVSLRLAKLAKKEEEELYGKWIPTMEIKLDAEIKKTGKDRILFLSIDLYNAGKIMTIPSYFIINLWQYRPDLRRKRSTLLFENDESYTIFFRQKLEYNKSTLPEVTYDSSFEGKDVLTPFSSEDEGKSIERYDGKCNKGHWKYRSNDILGYRYKQGEGRKFVFPITIHGHGTFNFRVQVGFLRQKEIKGQMVLDLKTEDFKEIGTLDGWKKVLEDDPSIDPKELSIQTGHYSYTEDIYGLVPAYDDINHNLEIAKVFVDQQKFSRAIQEINKMTPEEKEQYSEEIAEFYFKSAQDWETKDDLKDTDSARESSKKKSQRISFSEAFIYMDLAHNLNPENKIYQEKYDYMKSISKYGEQIADKVPVVSPLVVEIGVNIMKNITVPATDNLRQEMFDGIKATREKINDTYGVTIPGIRFRDNSSLGPWEFTIAVNEVQVDKGSLNGKEIDVIKALMNALQPLIENHLADFVGHDFVKRLLDNIVIFNVEDKDLSEFTVIVRKLLEEKVPITSLEAIVQEFNTCLAENKDCDEAYRNIRSLPSIRNVLPGNNENSQIYQLGKKTEEKIAHSIKDTGYQKMLDIEPNLVNDILNEIRRYTGRYRRLVIVVKNSLIREFVQELLDIEFHITCLSRNELQRHLINRIRGEIEIV